MKIGCKTFDFSKRTYIMGILNVTPDSFSDGGQFFSVEQAVRQGEKLIQEGTDIIDIGGESTRPFHETITVSEEIARVVPVITALKKAFPSMPLSIDTWKCEVAKAAVSAGADFVNDIWGLQKDQQMAKFIAEKNLPCCIMHNRDSGPYESLIPDMIADLRKSLDIAKEYNIPKENILLDPGIGFAKNYEENLQVMRELKTLKDAFPEYPMLLATSRKSMIGKALGDVPVDNRVIGTVATTVIGVMAGCGMVRVHDVKENLEGIKMADAIRRKEHSLG